MKGNMIGSELYAWWYMFLQVQNTFTLEIEETKESFFINKVYLKSESLLSNKEAK